MNERLKFVIGIGPRSWCPITTGLMPWLQIKNKVDLSPFDRLFQPDETVRDYLAITFYGSLSKNPRGRAAGHSMHAFKIDLTHYSRIAFHRLLFLGSLHTC